MIRTTVSYAEGEKAWDVVITMRPERGTVRNRPLMKILARAIKSAKGEASAIGGVIHIAVRNKSSIPSCAADDGWKRMQSIERIATALQAEREKGRAECEKQHFRPPNNPTPKAIEIKGIVDCTGDIPVVRKVLGTLPVTADGFVVGGGARLFAPSATDGGLVFDIHTPGPSLEIIDSEGTFTGEMWDLPEHCYSTKESAIEATKKGPA